MPFASEAQRRKFYAMARRGEISMKKVKEYERETKGKKLPEHVGKKKHNPAKTLTKKQRRQHGHATPPKGYPSMRSQYADPSNYKFPVNTPARVRNAAARIMQSKSNWMYSAAELAAIKKRIRAAGKRLAVEVTI